MLAVVKPAWPIAHAANAAAVAVRSAPATRSVVAPVSLTAF
jgi:hypothetical protein